jgi:hypothetical protein
MVSLKEIGSSACEAVGDSEFAELLGTIKWHAEVVYIFHVKYITKICIYAGTSSSTDALEVDNKIHSTKLKDGHTVRRT